MKNMKLERIYKLREFKKGDLIFFSLKKDKDNPCENSFVVLDFDLREQTLDCIVTNSREVMKLSFIQLQECPLMFHREVL